jgi:hypothetical protein
VQMKLMSFPCKRARLVLGDGLGKSASVNCASGMGRVASNHYRDADHNRNYEPSSTSGFG